MEIVLDASSAVTYAGLARQGSLVWTSAPIASQEHTLRLVPEVERGMAATSTVPRDIQLVVVALGPGPFNALRVAVSAAKGFAAGTGAALAGIETLLAEALRCPPSIGRVRPVLRAARTGFVTAVYSREGGGWRKVEEERYVDEVALAQSAADGTPLCGDDAPGICEQLRQASGVEPACVRPLPMSRLEALAAEGWARYRAGELAATATLQPLYARPPHITPPKDRR